LMRAHFKGKSGTGARARASAALNLAYVACVPVSPGLARASTPSWCALLQFRITRQALRRRPSAVVGMHDEDDVNDGQSEGQHRAILGDAVLLRHAVHIGFGEGSCRNLTLSSRMWTRLYMRALRFWCAVCRLICACARGAAAVRCTLPLLIDDGQLPGCGGVTRCSPASTRCCCGVCSRVL
jgi:hypothetical protein